MPKFLFYAGTVFALFAAVSSAAEAVRELQTGSVSFVALQGAGVALRNGPAAWSILAALVMAIAVSSLFIRMASLLAPRNLFAAFLALFSIVCTFTTFASLLFVQLRIVSIARGVLSSLPAPDTLSDLHLTGYLMAGSFLSITLLTLRPYFRVQASPWLSILVFLPAPVFCTVLAREISAGTIPGALPAGSPPSFVFFAVLAILFLSIAVHCIRHRHLFIEMTNLRELLDVRADPLPRRPRRPAIGGGVAFDS